MIIRILTEDKHRHKVLELTRRYFEGFTIYNGVASWRGTYENSLTIEHASNPTEPDSLVQLKAERLASEIKADNKQEEVLIEVIHSHNYII